MDRLTVAALLLADARLPAGGHAHSGGLEHAVAAGSVRTPAELGGWLEGRLRTTGWVDAAFAAAAAMTEPGGWPDLDQEVAARIPSHAARRASRAQGRGLVRAARAAWPGPWAEPLRRLPDGGPLWPVALGAAAAAAGLPPGDAALLAASAAVQGPAWAATRLAGMDPFAVTAVLGGLQAAVEETATSAARAAATRPYTELSGWSAPLLDLAAEEHATWEVRLFAS